MFSFICNTVVLFLSGVIIAERAIFKNSSPLELKDILHLIGLYIVTFLVRGIMTAAL